MALNKIQIISQALSLIGIPGTQSIDPNNKDQVFAEQAFDFLYPTTLAKEDWRFATAIQQLSQLVETPIIDEYRYAYQLPAGFLAIVRPYNLSRFQIYEDKLYSNENELKLEYRFEVDISKAPDYFTEYMIYVLAEYLTLALAEKIEYETILRQKKKETGDRAAYLDAQGHSNFQIQFNPFIDIRGSSRGTIGVR
jgi:hypothetical protein